MAIIRNQNTAASFFQTQASSSSADALITLQVDPSQPQVEGLSTVTDPLIPDRRVAHRLSNFDPELYDLSEDSHLMRLIKALLGASGVGGLRRQMMIARMAATALTGTNFLDLDGFWGSLFNLSRAPAEHVPTQPDGSAFNPMTDATVSPVWEAMASRDGRYRSRITALARAFNMGATYFGMTLAAEAILGCEVEITEAWVFADEVPVGDITTVLDANTYFVLESQYGTWGAMSGISWGILQGGTQVTGDAPLGNRGEINVIPKRAISEVERRQVMVVLDALKPSGTMITVQPNPIQAYTTITPRGVYADSVDWQVVSSITPYQGLTSGDAAVYANQTGQESSRPAFGRYSGEKWSYNSRISSVQSYVMENNVPLSTDPDAETITFYDGMQHTYVAKDALVSAVRMILGRLASEGVMTTYAYAPGRSA